MATQKDFVVKNGIIVNQNITINGKAHDRILDSADVLVVSPLGDPAGTAVALAIALGGPGSTFWMIICGLLGMSTKFVECTLGVYYRDVDKDGVVYGGPMYYISRGLKSKGFKTNPTLLYVKSFGKSTNALLVSNLLVNIKR